MFRLHCQPDLSETPSSATCRHLLQVGRQVLAVHATAGAVDAVLTDDDHVRRLNAAYRSRDRTTDVLAFAFEESSDDVIVGDAAVEPTVGEVYISVQRASEQADELGVTQDEELSRLLVHGLLHLVGFDHQTEEELVAMERETERFLAAVPVGGANRSTALAGCLSERR
jgi:probable rRNA maturation factor